MGDAKNEKKYKGKENLVEKSFVCAFLAMWSSTAKYQVVIVFLCH